MARALASGSPRGTRPISQSDVKARHDKVACLVKTMMTADSLQLTACG